MTNTPSEDRFIINRHLQKTFDFGMLYLSKVGTIAINLLVLPQLQRILSPTDFGLVALFFTLQALFIVLDLGLALTVGRDVAIAKKISGRAARTWRSAELAITIAYFIFFVLAILTATFKLLPIGPTIIALAVLTFWLLTMQNIGYSALIARRDFASAAGILVAGSLLRGGGALIALIVITPSIEVFLASQAVVAAAQYASMRSRCNYILKRNVPCWTVNSLSIPAAGALLLRARSLAVFGLSGAIVLQADKLIISGFNGSSAVIAYYLANTLCLVPISSLAGPVASYFQPGVLSSIGSRSQTSTFIQLKRMLLLLSGVTLPPTVAIWLFRDDIIRIWLVGSPNAPGGRIYRHITTRRLHRCIRFYPLSSSTSKRRS